MKTELPKDKQEFIDNHFNECDEPTRAEFDQLTTSEELHYLACNYNFDSGVNVLQWIAESEQCSEATALLIFWSAQPEEYTEYSWNAKKLPQSVEVEVFDLIRTIIENFKKGFYRKTDISYDPKEDMPESDIIPQIMLQSTNGEEPYIYYNDGEVDSWHDDYLDNQLYRCDNAIELFNIAGLLKYGRIIEIYHKVINHPFCDKGIALMCFWRLKNYANPYAIEEISKDIIYRIENNHYKEVLRYNPQDDRDIKIQQVQKWIIPNEMRKAI